MNEYYEMLNPARKYTVDRLCNSDTGAELFTILAGNFPASELIQGATLAIAWINNPRVYSTLLQVTTDDVFANIVLRNANKAHAARKSREVININNEGRELVTFIAGRILTATKYFVFEKDQNVTFYHERLALLPSALNEYDPRYHRKSRVKVEDMIAYIVLNK